MPVQEVLANIRKYGLYVLAALGVLLVLWVFWEVFGGVATRTSVSPIGYRGAMPPMTDAGVSLADPLGKTLEFGEDLFDGGGGGAPAAESPRAPSQTVQEGNLTQRKVVKNGSLALLVKNAEETAQGIQGIAERVGGFVQGTNVYEVSAGVKAGSVTVRVPAARFGETLDAIKNLAVKVEREQVNAADVTEHFTDLEAQLRNLRVEEAQLLEIMEKAFTVNETLNVAQRLSAVRGQIERIQGQLQYLSRQVDMSTIAVSLTSEADVEVFGIRWRPLVVVKQAFRDLITGITGYVDALIRFIFRLPVYFLWIATIGAVLVGVLRAGRWAKRRFFSSPS